MDPVKVQWEVDFCFHCSFFPPRPPLPHQLCKEEKYKELRGKGLQDNELKDREGEEERENMNEKYG